MGGHFGAIQVLKELFAIESGNHLHESAVSFVGLELLELQNLFFMTRVSAYTSELWILGWMSQECCKQ